MSAKEAKNFVGKSMTYHWDDVVDQTGNIVNHGKNNPHGGAKHLQIHDDEGNIFRIFFD
ncbi:hypothetical protein [Thermoflexibacter ruber]|uniref:Uncharacterized protein n=1 Tax=Thermoflexibacter ruber TaxID=1003 RepID=A0A1I2JSM8_9BACT|nr:hypothetical protein [Thermoflexibacter ruber]SFF57842.1 hypothetical protein SAMN04488541_106512 [Thermoflexibacter ruber]